MWRSRGGLVGDGASSPNPTKFKLELLLSYCVNSVTASLNSSGLPSLPSRPPPPLLLLKPSNPGKLDPSENEKDGSLIMVLYFLRFKK